MKNILLTTALLISCTLISAQDNTNKIKITYGAENEVLPKDNDTIVEYHDTTDEIKKLKFRNSDKLTIIEYMDNGQEFKKSVYSMDNLKFKTVTKYHSNGNVRLIANYDNGVVTGNFQKFHDNGKIKSKGVYYKMKKMVFGNTMITKVFL